MSDKITIPTTEEYLRQKGVYTSYMCHNDVLLERVAELYFRDGMKIADVTWGKGVFWKLIDLSKYHFYKSDIITCPDSAYDFTNLPREIYVDDSFDVVVFDPPYVHNPGRMFINDAYKNAETTKGFYHLDIIHLYRQGMTEARRVLKPGGLLLVKCKDEIESNVQKRSHIEVWDIGVKELDMIDEDLFVMTQKICPTIQHKQQHARKNCSFLWVFKKDK